MNAHTLKAQAYRALLAGTGREPLKFQGDLAELAQEDTAKATLRALSLTGQALRFERPLPPPGFAVESIVTDRRPILPETTRNPLVRLLKDRRSSDDLALALAWGFDRHKVRPHPFDLPKIDGFVRTNSEYLGAAAQHWAQNLDPQRGGSSSEPLGYFDGDRLDDTTWNGAPPAQRARFIAARRRDDPAAARVLVELVWTNESADARVRLLSALESGLSEDDKSFLEGLSKDRAPRVRALAQRFLARLSSYRGEHPALAACLERVRRSTAGLLRKHTTLALELPATVKEFEAKAWIRETFSELSCEELARALRLTEVQMIEAAEKDTNLSLAFAWIATQDRRLDLLRQLTEGQLSEAWVLMSQTGPVDLTVMPSEERMEWAGILIQPYTTKLLETVMGWSWMHRALEGPAPALFAESVLHSSGPLFTLLEEKKIGTDALELAAALCPASHRARLRTALGSLDSSQTLTVLPLLDILETLEKVGAHEQEAAAS